MNPKSLALRFRTLFALLFATLLTLTPWASIPASAAPLPQSSGTPDAAVSRAQHAYGKLPLSFEPNAGQTDASVSYLAHGSQYTVFVTPRALTLAMHSAVPTLRRTEATRVPEWSASVRMLLAGANERASMSAEQPLSGVVSYLRGKDFKGWQQNLPTYARARAADVYPGIDAVYYGTEGHLEYDFEVAPGADPCQIRMKFEGATPLIEANGDLVLSLGDKDHTGEVRLHRPVMYQGRPEDRSPVTGRFVIADKEVRFEIGGYDHTRALTIDPYVEYSSYLGGSTQDTLITGMTTDAAGAMYVTGTTHAVDYPTTAGVIQPVCPVNLPNGTSTLKCGVSSPGVAFVAKIAADGQSLAYSTFIGGSGAKIANGALVATGADAGGYVAVDSSGNAWLAGQTISNDFPITSDGIQQYCSPVAAGFSFQSNSYFGIQSGCYHQSSGIFQYGSPDVFVVKLNPTGTAVIYGTYLGGYAYEEPVGLALDSAGNVFIGGNTQSSSVYGGSSAQTGGFYLWDATEGYYLFPTTSTAYQIYGNYAASVSVPFLTELTANGQAVSYSTTLWEGTAYACQNADCGDVTAQAMAIGGGRVTLVGHTAFTLFPTLSGAVKAACTPAINHTCNTELGFASVLDTTKTGAASLIYSTYIGGTTPAPNFLTHASAVAMNSSGDVVVGGDTQQSDFPTTSGALQTSCALHSANQCGTAFVLKINAAGTLSWSTLFGSPSGLGSYYGVSALALDSSSNVFITDLTDAPDLPTKNGLMAFSTGNAYIAELASDGKSEIFGTFFGAGGTLQPKAISVNASGNVFLAGYSNGQVPLVRALQKTNASGFNEGFFAKIVTALVSGTTTITVVPNGTASAGSQETLTATVAAPPGAPTATGSVTFKNGSNTLGTATLNSTGLASYSAVLPSGAYSITAAYGGDSVYNATTSSAASLTVSKGASNTVLTTSSASLGTGSSVTFTATVTVGVTGTVTFYNGSTSLGTGTLGSNGVATLTTSFATAGSYNITASYGGDTAYNPSTSAAVIETVVTPSFTATASPCTVTISRGKTASIPITITPVGGFAGTITPSCGTLPAFATCMFSPATVTLTSTSGAVTTTLTIGTGATLGLSTPLQFGKDQTNSGIQFAMLLPGTMLGLVALSRRRGRLIAAMRSISIALLFFAGLAAVSGCGGPAASTASATTPAGTYPITISIAGTSGSAQTVNITVIVQ